MKRKDFLRSLLAIPLIGSIAKKMKAEDAQIPANVDPPYMGLIDEMHLHKMGRSAGLRLRIGDGPIMNCEVDNRFNASGKWEG